MTLTDDKIKWIINMKKDNKLSTKDIATIQHVSTSRIRQLWSQYIHTGVIPTLGKAGRPPRKQLSSEDEQVIINAYMKHKCGAVYLERVLKSEGFNFSHNAIHKVLMKNRLSTAEPNKRSKRKYVKYERRHSMSLWHTDWYEIADPRWRGKYLIVYLDDSSRFVVGYGVYDNATAENAIKLLDECISKYGKPRELLTDHGSQFYSNFGDRKSEGKSAFQVHLEELGIRHIVGRVHHPQTNGKVERFYGTFQQKIRLFDSIDELMHWYNYDKPHLSLDFEHVEKPAEAFYSRLDRRRKDLPMLKRSGDK
ncbi:MAG: DDE-type integrase/transposase/recombinase [Thaumarchaeota archaeon]|nr:DDE-type integrase/transposase/recombinase [Nitrososphaerota archaeon]